MAMILTFPPDLETRLRARAAASAKDVESFIREAVEEKLAAENCNGTAGAPRGTIADLVALLKSFPKVDDGWAEGVEEAIRLGN